MNGDRGPSDRPELEDLVQRARIELRDWTDTTDHDPGVALLELYALLGDLLSSHSERLANEAHLGSGRRRSEDRRDEIEFDVEEPSRPTCGVYRAIVIDNADPLVQSRLLVRVPDVSADEAVWAAACLPVPGAGKAPAVGEEVWIALESRDPSRPIWLGRRVTD